MNNALLDAVIVGAGPAGCSAASWLAQLGLRAVLLEREAVACATLAGLDIRQDWVLGAPKALLGDLGLSYAGHLATLGGVDLRTDHGVTALRLLPAGGWQVEAGGERFEARCLVLATGLRPRRPTAYFGAAGDRVMDAVSLTARRANMPPGDVLLLGGGDNAVENALYLAERGHRVTLWTRTGWRAQPSLMARLKAVPGLSVREAAVLPQITRADGARIEVQSQAHGAEAFDMMAVLFGYEPDPQAFALAHQALRDAGLPSPADDLAQRLPEVPAAGLLVAGDASGRGHPCVQTALADGVAVAKRVQAHARPAAAAPAQRSQVLRLTGLRFDARLGWLDREKRGPQPIEVDAELNMGPQPLLPDDDDLSHVLDYRKVRQIIIDECNAEHTHLIETLLGKLCQRLVHLPGVLGVRVRVTKLEIFDDCHVAMSAEHGQW